MVSTLEVPLSAHSADLKLPETGSAKTTTVALPLVYTGSEPARVLAFVAKAAGESVQLELTYPDRSEDPYKVVAKLTGARVRLPSKGMGERLAIVLSFKVTRGDTREPRELLEFLLAAAHAEALELDCRARIVQEPLPFEEAGEESGDPRPARARAARAAGE